MGFAEKTGRNTGAAVSVRLAMNTGIAAEHEIDHRRIDSLDRYPLIRRIQKCIVHVNRFRPETLSPGEHPHRFRTGPIHGMPPIDGVPFSVLEQQQYLSIHDGLVQISQIILRNPHPP